MCRCRARTEGPRCHGIGDPLPLAGRRHARAGYKSSPQEEHLAHLSSSDAPLVVMEPTEHGDCVDAAIRLEWTWNRLLVPEGLVRTRFVVVADVLGDDAPEVILTEDEDVVEHLSPECADEGLSKGIHVRRTYRRSHDAHARRPSTPGNREPSFVSWSQTTTCGTRSMVAFLACCAHHSSVGAEVTAAWRIVRRRRSRKKSTNTSRNRMSKVWTKSQAHVTWFRRKVDQLCPLPGGRKRRMYL